MHFRVSESTEIYGREREVESCCHFMVMFTCCMFEWMLLLDHSMKCWTHAVFERFEMMMLRAVMRPSCMSSISKLFHGLNV